MIVHFNKISNKEKTVAMLHNIPEIDKSMHRGQILEMSFVWFLRRCQNESMYYTTTIFERCGVYG